MAKLADTKRRYKGIETVAMNINANKMIGFFFAKFHFHFEGLGKWKQLF